MPNRISLPPRAGQAHRPRRGQGLAPKDDECCRPIGSGQQFIAEADLMAAVVVLGTAAPAGLAPRHEPERPTHPRSNKGMGAQTVRCVAVSAAAAPLGPAMDGEGARPAPRRSVQSNKAAGEGRRVAE